MDKNKKRKKLVMFSEFVGIRVADIRQGILREKLGEEATFQASRLLAAIEESAFCFRIEPWHNVNIGDDRGAAPISEMLFHVLGHDCRKINVKWAISSIYEAGLTKEFDSVIVALAVQQAEAQKTFPVAINISPVSACNRQFWQDIGPILSRHNPRNFVFELVEEDYEPGEEEKSTLLAVRRMGYRFALDDMENNVRDENRLESFGDIVDFIKIDGGMVEEWELGLPGLVSFLDRLRKNAGHAAFIAEWVTSVAKARHLAEMGFNAVQGRCLPISRREFCLRYAQSPVYSFNPQGLLTKAFTGVLDAAV